MQFLRVRQIYFDEASKASCEPSYVPYDNSGKCTVFFENSVIADLICNGDHLDSEYYGVISHNMRTKLEKIIQWKAIFQKDESQRPFSADEFKIMLQAATPDVMSYGLHPAQDQIRVGEKFHPGFTRHWMDLMQRLGLEWSPDVWTNILYCNMFVAKSEIYESYVHELLIPAIEVMSQTPELLKPCYYAQDFPERLHKELGRKTWCWHPFICERLFSYFVNVIHKGELKIISY